MEQKSASPTNTQKFENLVKKIFNYDTHELKDQHVIRQGEKFEFSKTRNSKACNLTFISQRHWTVQSLARQKFSNGIVFEKTEQDETMIGTTIELVLTLEEIMIYCASYNNEKLTIYAKLFINHEALEQIAAKCMFVIYENDFSMSWHLLDFIQNQSFELIDNFITNSSIFTEVNSHVDWKFVMFNKFKESLLKIEQFLKQAKDKPKSYSEPKF